MEPGYNEPPYNEVVDVMNDFPYPSYSTIYEKEPQYNRTSLYSEQIFSSPLAHRYFKIPL